MVDLYQIFRAGLNSPGRIGVLEKSRSAAADSATATASLKSGTQGHWSWRPRCRSNLFRQGAKRWNQQIGRVLERTKEITRWKIAVFLRLPAKLDDGSQVLTYDREEMLHSAGTEFFDPKVRRDTFHLENL